ncbi:MAG: arsenic transporter [Chloroflexi bacterium]|nr:arsenic transporter [Chloroflexota bacterium]
MHVVLVSSIFAGTLFLIMVRPRGLSEAFAACGGALLMIITGSVTLPEAVMVVAHEWNVFGFFLGLMTIAAIADRAQFFDVISLAAARWARGSGVRLYLAIFAIGTLITAVLSNDATALILTPVVYTLVTRLRLKVLPFMFACTFIADTASFLLPVSNPTNILILSSFGGSLGEFLRFLFLPSLFCISVNVVIFVWLFRRDIDLCYDPAALAPLTRSPREQRFFQFVVVCLMLIAIGYVSASLVGVPVSFVALTGGAVMLVGALIMRQLAWSRLAHDISWPIFAFVGGMFIVIRAIENVGLTAALGRLVLGNAASSMWSVVRVTFGTAIGANMINNVPMALVMVSGLRSQVGLPPATQTATVYATIFGAALGPNLTTVGSLATMLWLLILRRKGLDISSREYLKLGLSVVPIMLLGGALLIALGW